MAAHADEPAERGGTHSGRLLLRMPPALHSELAKRSDEAGASLNQYIVDVLGDSARPRAGDGELPRSVRTALVVNSIAAAVAAATAIVALIVAWH
jgi:hypothetical protein